MSARGVPPSLAHLYLAPSPEAVRALREDAERRLSAEEVAAYADSPMSAEELAGIVAQIE